MLSTFLFCIKLFLKHFLRSLCTLQTLFSSFTPGHRATLLPTVSVYHSHRTRICWGSLPWKHPLLFAVWNTLVLWIRLTEQRVRKYGFGHLAATYATIPSSMALVESFIENSNRLLNSFFFSKLEHDNVEYNCCVWFFVCLFACLNTALFWSLQSTSNRFQRKCKIVFFKKANFF